MTSASDILDGGAHCVIANPPYIVPPTKEARDAYRKRYVSAYDKFGLGAPFTERLWQLVAPRGYVAEITSNAFMKREYGKPLIEQVIPRLNLQLVIDTSGAFIPGHGTPTCILAGRGAGCEVPENILAVQAKRGEPTTPEEGECGAVWSSILQALGYNPPQRRAYGLEGVRIAKALKKSCRPLIKRLGAEQFGRFATIAAVLKAFEARGYLARREEHLWDALWRLEERLPLGSHAFDAEGIPVSEDAAEIRAALDAVSAPHKTAPRDPRSGWAVGDTDWLGDLYQALVESAGEENALCQTPWFVRDLLLDLALGGAVETFGIDGLRVLDPTCGTGHLLVGAFWRLFAKHMDTMEHTEYGAANLALRSCQGVELNSTTAWLCRVRLMLAWLDATGAGLTRHVEGEDALARVRIEQEPAIAVGDALLEGVRKPSPPLGAVIPSHATQVKQLGLFAGAA